MVFVHCHKCGEHYQDSREHDHAARHNPHRTDYKGETYETPPLEEQEDE